MARLPLPRPYLGGISRFPPALAGGVACGGRELALVLVLLAAQEGTRGGGKRKTNPEDKHPPATAAASSSHKGGRSAKPSVGRMVCAVGEARPQAAGGHDTYGPLFDLLLHPPPSSDTHGRSGASWWQEEA